MIKVVGLHANNTLSQVVETRPCRYQVFDDESIIIKFKQLGELQYLLQLLTHVDYLLFLVNINVYLIIESTKSKQRQGPMNCMIAFRVLVGIAEANTPRNLLPRRHATRRQSSFICSSPSCSCLLPRCYALRLFILLYKDYSLYSNLSCCPYRTEVCYHSCCTCIVLIFYLDRCSTTGIYH